MGVDYDDSHCEVANGRKSVAASKQRRVPSLSTFALIRSN